MDKKNKNNQQNVQKTNKLQYYLICVDPDSRQIYSVNTNTNEVIIETNVPFYIRQQANISIDTLQQIVPFEIENKNQIIWNINQSKPAQQFMRRKIPSYLLQKDVSKFPTYLCQSNLSMAFANVNIIKVVVNFSQYEYQFQRNHRFDTHAQSIQTAQVNEILLMQQQDDKITNIDINNSKLTITMEAGLITSANEVIKNAIREIYKEREFKIKPNNENNQFVFQVTGLNEFIYGNHPILSYDRVRMKLRGCENLDVILTEMPKKLTMFDNFPPVIIRKKKDIRNILNEGFYDNQINNIQQIEEPDNQRKKKISLTVLGYSSDENDDDEEDENDGENEEDQNSVNNNNNNEEVQQDQKFKDNNCQESDNISSQVKLKAKSFQSDQLIANKNKKNKIQKGEIIWDQMKKIPHIIWYPPVKLPPYDQNREPKGIDRFYNINIIEGLTSEFSKINLKQQKDFSSLDTDIAREVKRFKHGQLSILKKIQQNQLKQQSLHEFNSLYSGECDCAFKIRILNLENMMNILFSDQEGLQDFKATYNGYNDPNYISKSKDSRSQQQKQHQLQQLEMQIYQLQQQHQQQQQKRQSMQIDGESKKELLQDKINTMTIEQGSQHFQSSKNQNFLHFCKEKDGIRNKSSSDDLIVKLKQLSEQRDRLTTNFYVSDSEVLTHYTNHGINGSGIIREVSHQYGLQFSPYLIAVEVFLYYGSNLIAKTQTKKIPFNFAPRWMEWLQFKKIRNWPSLKISQLPLEIRACFAVVLYSSHGGQVQVLGSSATQIFDDQGRFQQGIIKLNLWPFYMIDERHVCMQNYYGPTFDSQKQACDQYAFLSINFEQFDFPVFWRLRDDKLMNFYGFSATNGFENQSYNNNNSQINSSQQNDLQLLSPINKRLSQKSDFSNEIVQLSDLQQFNSSVLKSPQNAAASMVDPYEEGCQSIEYDWNATPKTDDLAKLHALLNTDPISRFKLTELEKCTLIKCRNHYKTLTYALPIFLQAIDWTHAAQVEEAHNMLKLWHPLPVEDALPLLDAIYADELVRLYAVERLSMLSDDDLALYMLELTQALKYETSHFSPLGEMLLERALLNPHVVGHELFWQLKSQLKIRLSFERYALIMQQFLMLCGSYREELAREVSINDKLNNIALEVKNKEKEANNMQELYIYVRELLKRYGESIEGQPLTFAIDNRLRAKSFNIEKCSVLNSKKLPLWLSMKNWYSEKDLISILFKCGDDIRQDVLTLQLFKIMDKIWLDNGHDFKMKPYKVITTNDQVGMIEVVPNSETTAKIHVDYGGTFGALKNNTIWQYLQNYNNDIGEQKSFETAKDNFLRSCAGYCVATYVLGIGDRHSGNIMVSQAGHLFHIDFGHFLGHFKYKYHFKRERAPFVLTEEMAFVMGGREGQNFKKFEEYCTIAYNLVRKHSNFIINIFLLMLSAGMPELTCISDIEYLKNQLCLNLSEQEATNNFKKEIATALNDNWRKIDNLIHNLKRDTK